MAVDRTAINALIAALVNDSGDDESGTVVFKANIDAWFDAVFDAIDAQLGDWTAIAFSAGNFAANGSMTWTVAGGSVSRNKYQIVNKTLRWQLTMAANTTVGGTPSTLLLIAIPTGTFSDAASRDFNVELFDAGTRVAAKVQVVDGTHIGIMRADGANLSAGSTTGVSFNIAFQLA